MWGSHVTPASGCEAIAVFCVMAVLIMPTIMSHWCQHNFSKRQINTSVTRMPAFTLLSTLHRQIRDCALFMLSLLSCNLTLTRFVTKHDTGLASACGSLCKSSNILLLEVPHTGMVERELPLIIAPQL